MRFTERSWLVRHWKSLFASLTVTYDSVIIVFLLGVGYAINFDQNSFSGFFQHQWKLVVYTLVLYVGLSAILGVYRQAYTSPLRLQMAAALRAYALGTLTIFATLFLFRNTYYSNGALWTYVVFILVGFLLGRLILDKLRAGLHHRRWALEPTVIVLVDDHADEQLRDLAAYPSIGFDVQHQLDVSGMNADETRQCIGDMVRAYNPACVICASSSLDSPQLNGLFAASPLEGMTIRLVSPEIHDALTRTRLYDFAGIIFSSPSRISARPAYRLLKRTFDIALSIVTIVVGAPVLVVIAVAIRLESSGSVFFRQVRSMTQQSKPVRVLKFRSMDENAQDLEALDRVVGGQRNEVMFKSPTDPRVTRVGRWIRKYSLDELPQLFNVITGDMSLVGPRPLPNADFNKLPASQMIASMYERRALATPGLTGLWQISGRSRLNFLQMVILDLYYAENQTFLFDLEILLETIPAVISGRGAY